jgi:putative membrane protein (TIGR04086 family)
MIPAVILVITTISVFTGSIIASKNIKKNGLINGAALGIIYILILYLVSSIFITGFSLNIKSLIMLALSIGAGIIGGIVGVNL